ncbi:hypothetical protein [Natrialba magadii]|uniref:hypothetical protein n=1 Tax=Natrialba magadii TaxID=13769 RepID=UPI0011D0E757|nr:hypothetical protein [Natrialba magadii]
MVDDVAAGVICATAGFALWWGAIVCTAFVGEIFEYVDSFGNLAEWIIHEVCGTDMSVCYYSTRHII